MQKLFEKTKPILLLIGLTTVTVGLVWIVNQVKGTNTFYSGSSSVEAANFVDETASATTDTDTISPQKVTEDTSTKQVLAATSGSTNQCVNALNTYNTVSICTRNSGDVQYKEGGSYSGGYVRKNAKVYLTKVTVPLVLLSGEKVIKDSNRKLTQEDFIYKPAGEQFTDKEANVELPPGTSISEYKPYTSDKPFGTEYSVSFTDSESTPSDQGEIVVDEKLKNSCEYCNNNSNANPDKTNKISEYLYDIRVKTPNDSTKPTSNDDEVESCSAKDTFEDLDAGAYDACKVSFGDAIAVAVQAQISAPIFDACKLGYTYDENGNQVPPSDNCVRTEDIVVKVSSAFGSETSCEDGVCTNAYMNARNRSALSPIDASSYSDSRYYLTPCQAWVDGTLTNVKCAWDLSYLFKERTVSEFDDVGTEKTPSINTYNDFLKKESGARANETPVKMF